MGNVKRGRKKRFQILIYFALWKSLLSYKEKQTYDCTVCRSKNLDKTRICYRYNDTVKLKIPHVIEWYEERGMPIMDEQWNEDITAEDLIDNVIVPFSSFVPDKPAFEVVMDIGGICGWNKELCVTGLIETDYVEIMDLFQLCKDYKALPASGGVLDQEPKLMEIFQILRAEELKFEKIRSETRNKKGK